MRLVTIVFLPLLLGAADQGTNGWIAVGPGATVENSNGVMTLKYDAGATQHSLAALPAEGMGLGQMKALSFELKTDSPFAVAFVMSEKKPGGGNYSAAIWSNGVDWQPVILAASDFSLNDAANDPEDADGRLDLDQVEHVGLLDLSQFMSGMARNSPFYTEPHSGAHSLSIRNMKTLPEAPAADRPQAAWFGFGGTSFEQSGGVLTIRYKKVADRFTAFTRLIPPHDFAGATHLAMDLQSDRDVQLVISIQESKARGGAGARYNIDVTVPASSKSEHRDILLSAFQIDENGPADPDHKLSLNAIHSLTILDVSGEEGSNTIRLQDLRLKTIH